MSQYDGWVKWAVGCHWSRGPYTVSTIRQGARSGYILVKDREVLGQK